MCNLIPADFITPGNSTERYFVTSTGPVISRPWRQFTGRFTGDDINPAHRMWPKGYPAHVPIRARYQTCRIKRLAARRSGLRPSTPDSRCCITHLCRCCGQSINPHQKMACGLVSNNRQREGHGALHKNTLLVGRWLILFENMILKTYPRFKKADIRGF